MKTVCSNWHFTDTEPISKDVTTNNDYTTVTVYHFSKCNVCGANVSDQMHYDDTPKMNQLMADHLSAYNHVDGLCG